MRDKSFYINAIKMDLFRVVTAAGDITTKFPYQSIKEFLNHAQSDFEKIPKTEHEQKLYKELALLANSIDQSKINNPDRLRWAEKILTIRCRL